MSSAFSPAARDGLGPEELRLLASVAAEAAACDGLPSLLNRLSLVLSSLVEFEQLALAMPGADGRYWELVCPRDVPAEELHWSEMRSTPSPLRECLGTGRDVLVSRAGSMLMSPTVEANPRVDFATYPSALCLPLHGVSDTLGAIGVFTGRGGAYAADQLHLMRIIAGFVEATARRLMLSEQVVRAENELLRVERLGTSAVRFIAADLRESHSELEKQLLGTLSTLLASQPPESRGAVDELRARSQRLRELIAVMEDVGRFEDGELVARSVPVPLSAFLRERLDRRMAQAQRAGILLSGRADRERMVGEFDRDLVARVLDVLLDNAFAHTPQGGRISVVARNTAHALTLAVGDTGTRVPDSDRERLFSRYGRIEGENDPPRLSGTFGLYFCRLVAKAHRGSLTIEDLPGAGSVFLMTLPQ